MNCPSAQREKCLAERCRSGVARGARKLERNDVGQWLVNLQPKALLHLSNALLSSGSSSHPNDTEVRFMCGTRAMHSFTCPPLLCSLLFDMWRHVKMHASKSLRMNASDRARPCQVCNLPRLSTWWIEPARIQIAPLDGSC